MDKLHQFYCRKDWRDLSYNLKIKAKGKCQRCKKVQSDFSQLIGHHKMELTEANVDDPSISLNPDMIEVICFDCHNKEHRRFGHKQSVYIVYGSPRSGKNTLVKSLMRPGDIVLDIDALWVAVTGQPDFVRPDNCRYNVFRMRDSLLDQIKTRYGQWYDAYVIGGYPDKYERERLAKELGAELLYVESTKEECIARVEASGKPQVWIDYIEKWWERYTE